LAREMPVEHHASSDALATLVQFLELTAQALGPLIGEQVSSTVLRGLPKDEPWRLLDLEEVAGRLGRSTRWVRERAKRGELPFVRLDGGALAFELEDVRTFVDSRRISAGEPSVLAEGLQQRTNFSNGTGKRQVDRATDP